MDDSKFERVDPNELSTEPIKNRGIPLAYPPGEPKIQEKTPATYSSVDDFNPQRVQWSPPVAPVATAAAPAEPPGPTVTQAAREVLRSRKESQTLQSLREAFGTKTTTRLEGEFAGHKWTFRVPASSDIQWSVVLMGDVIMLDSDLMTNLSSKRAMVAVSVAAINDRPLYEHFEVQLPVGYAVPDPLNPPQQLRHRASELMYSMLSNETVDELTLGLVKLFDQLVSPELAKAAPPLASTPPAPSSGTTQT